MDLSIPRGCVSEDTRYALTGGGCPSLFLFQNQIDTFSDNIGSGLLVLLAVVIEPFVGGGINSGLNLDSFRCI